MSHSLLSHHLDQKKNSYSKMHYQSLGMKNGVKHNNLQLKKLYRLETIFQILHREFLKHRCIAFENLKTHFADDVNMNHPFDKKLVRHFEVLFRVLRENRSRIQRFALNQIKSYVEGRLLVERMKSVLTKLALQQLIASSRIKQFKSKLVYSSRKTKKYYHTLKVRYFMAVCENIASKKNVPKELYKSFREWHLQSVLQRLASLNEGQREIVHHQKEIVTRLLTSSLTKLLQKPFSEIKLYKARTQGINAAHFYNLAINIMIRRLSVPFVKHSLVIFPGASWNSQKMDGLSLYKISQAFKKLKGYIRKEYRNPTQKLKGSLILYSVLNRKVFLITRSVMTSFILQYKANSRVNSVKSMLNYENIFFMCSIIKQLIMKKNVESFRAIAEYSLMKNRISPEAGRDFQIRTGIIKIETYCKRMDKSSIHHAFAQMKIHYELLKQEESVAKVRKIMDKRINIKCQKLKITLTKFYHKTLNNAWTALCHCQDLTLLDEMDIAQQERERIQYEKKMLLDVIKNQAMVNAKLEKSHQKKTLGNSKAVIKLRQASVLGAVLFKDLQRKQHNTQTLQKFFKKWQCKISFENAKRKEYINLLEILEGERDVYTAEIQQFEQVRLEKAEAYLKFLESRNSDLIEFVTPFEHDLERIEQEEEASNIIPDSKQQDICTEFAVRRRRTLSLPPVNSKLDEE